MWTTVVQVDPLDPSLLELVTGSETPVPTLTQHVVQATDPLRFFNRVSPIDVLWNFSAPQGSAPPFLVNSIVDQPAVEAMLSARGVYADWYRNRMVMGCVTNVYGINRDDDPANIPLPMAPFELFPEN